ELFGRKADCLGGSTTCEQSMVTHRLAIVAITVLLGGALLPAPSAAKSARHAQSHANAHRGPPPISAQAVNDAQFSPSLKLDKATPLMVKVEVLLDRNAISPGQIDGKQGDNARKAI